MGASGKVASGHGAGARDVVVVPRRSESVSRDTVCSLLMGQLQDECLFCFLRWLIL
jgi:hypothetical protein